MTVDPGSAPRAPIRALAAASLALLVACSGSEGTDGPPETPAESAAADRSTSDSASAPRIPDAELGDLVREQIELSLPWTRGRINRDAPGDPPPTTTLRSVSFSRVENVDRMTLEFDSAAAFPGFTVNSSVSPLPRCGSSDSVAVEGQGLLRVEIRNAAASDAVLGDELRRPELDNVTSMHRSCVEEARIEWVLGVERATFYRIVEASNPTRLVIDVMQSLEPESGEGAEGG